MIDITKKYRTRDGREVRIYATDGGLGNRVHDAIKNEHGWGQQNWNLKGTWFDDEESTCDLIEVRPRHKRTVWLNVYGGVSPSVWGEKEWADKYAEPNRIACIKVELDFEEGEGL